MKEKPPVLEPIRINRYLASCGLGSRRSCEAFIRSGLVKVNDKTVRSLSLKINPQDKVEFNGQILSPLKKDYFIFYKPRGFICSKTGLLGERTIYHILPPSFQKFFYVGRLDKDSEGLILLTNDGLLTNKILHPKFHFPKTYLVSLASPFDENSKKELLRGMYMEGKIAKVQDVQIKEKNRLKIILTQGIKRQIRNMLSILGYRVTRLQRISLGPLTLKGLNVGQYRRLTKKEIDLLYAAIEAASPANKTQ
ncbi:16S rRNA pseudouridylate synthase [Candidatus Methylacidiphilum fumarolicum]|uniref:Pseudouridine synthase n=2 Tax=Candidatus Methylacidiphilum fumarolicum TaxID=591154 RepID=I0K181_METFB|nr:pseudouridine synthase [Candidatus Methylacidiphilum fumarolicum]MBW6414993.1 rRNA pseudouridine synthase [Candidatus Methylacidiphilum fumarolicum]TFE70321.1 16S rRNA pseudouridylate synthase [Candidatus Methylacidiphilum fumarolicum]TFE73992.1 rRNA pseudouridine synthase [Candidatus Methylacidiphilum fumarolicum]TFE77833.1 16S rRNA pseudouridylate synthase [Candidatus Methylacidiphilum fumarolicum]CAI9086769.1 Pseudouridine synthase [Candidatus Methylacidiphilum fumarolicum]